MDDLIERMMSPGAMLGLDVVGLIHLLRLEVALAA